MCSDFVLFRDVPESKLKVPKGWAWEWDTPSHTLEKKNQDMNLMVASPAFSEP